MINIREHLFSLSGSSALVQGTQYFKIMLQQIYFVYYLHCFNLQICGNELLVSYSIVTSHDT